MAQLAKSGEGEASLPGNQRDATSHPAGGRKNERQSEGFVATRTWFNRAWERGGDVDESEKLLPIEMYRQNSEILLRRWVEVIPLVLLMGWLSWYARTCAC